MSAHLSLRISAHRIVHRVAVIPKFGSFYCNDLIGQPYGLSYEIVDKNLHLLPPPTLQEVGELPSMPRYRSVLNKGEEDTDATNELIVDDQLVQPLTVKEIKDLKQSGAHASVRIFPSCTFSSLSPSRILFRSRSRATPILL